MIGTTNIPDYNTSWEGKSGQEVSEFIRGNLEDAQTKAENSISNISFSAQGNKLSYSITKNDGSPVTTETVELKPVSSTIFDVTLVNGTEEQVVKKGSSVTIQYTYNCVKTVVDDLNNSTTTNEANHIANIDLTVLQGTKIKTFENFARAGKTYVNLQPTQSLTIPASNLFTGVNTITLYFHEDASGSTIESGNITANITIVNLLFNSIIADYNELKDKDNDTFNISTSIVAENINGDISYEGNTIEPKIIIAGRSVGSSEYTRSQLSALQFTLSTLKSAISDSIALTTNNPFIEFFIFARLIVNGTNIDSNVQYYRLGMQGTTIPVATFKLNITEIPISGAPIIDIDQYSNYKIPNTGLDTDHIVIYNPDVNDISVNYSLNENNIDNNYEDTKTLVSGANVCDFEYTYKYTGSASFLIYANSQSIFLIRFNIQSIGSSLVEPVGVAFSLTASGKNSNSEHTWSYNSTEVQFDDRFNWSGNGWGENKMVLNEGSTMIIPFTVCNNNTYTASFRFNTVGAVESEELISCFDDTLKTGFKIYPEKAVLINNNGSKVETEFLSSSPIEVTIVRYGQNYQYLQAIYINGVMQKVAQLDSSNIIAHSIPITVQASKCTLNLYNVNLYQRGLSFTEIQSLYIINKNDFATLSKYVVDNNVFKIDTTNIGDYGQQVTPDKLPAGSAVLIIKPSSTVPNSWEIINAYGGSDPDLYKGIRFTVESVKLIVKSTNGPLNEQPGNKRNFYAYIATISAQGTSSMSYPIKNFRFYFAKKSSGNRGDFNGYTGLTQKLFIGDSVTSDFVYDPNSGANYEGEASKIAYSLFSTAYEDESTYTSAPAKLFCLKADYAESSGSHNTGFARMANAALTGSGNIFDSGEETLFGTNNESPLTPPQQAVANNGANAAWKYDVRTTIDGRPVYLFFETENGYVYHGKYNMNNEKKSEDVFGFKGVKDYFNLTAVKNEATNLQNLFATAYGNDFTYNGENKSYYSICHLIDEDNSGNEYINPTECWEFSNNTFTVSPTYGVPQSKNSVGSFQFPYTPNATYPLFAQYPNLDPFTVRDNSNKLVWISQAWEYRFPDIEDEEGDAAYQNGATQPYLLKSLYKWLYKHNITLRSSSEKGSVADEFAAQLGLYFNVNYLLKYYVLTKWFANVDQRVKNCMLAFWCDPNATNNTDSESPTGHMRAFYIFYDNDTILGIDNQGYIAVPWDAKESWTSLYDNETHSYPGYGKHAIWDTLEYCYNLYITGQATNRNAYLLGQKIEVAYQKLRKQLPDATVKDYFENKQCSYYPDAIKNVDAQIKYFYPTDLVDMESDLNGVTNPYHLDDMQGSREFHRNRWLTKRSIWFDSKFKAGTVEQFKYKFKVSAEAGTGTDGGTVKVTTALDEWKFYAISNGQLLSATNLLAKDAIGTLTITPGSISVSDFVTIAGLYGASEIDFNEFNITSSIGDLNSLSEQGESAFSSLPYLKKFVLSYNTNVSTKKVSVDAMSKLINGTIAPNLEELYICNTISGDGSRFNLNLNGSSKLNKIDVRGTSIDLTLPDTSSLATLLYNDPINITLNNKRNLTDISIVDNSSVRTLNVNNSSEEVYTFALDLVLAKYNDQYFTCDISIVDGIEGQYIMSKAQLTKLNQIAQRLQTSNANIVIEGNVYAANLSDSDIDKNLISTVFPRLNISDDVQSGEFEITSSSLTLRENETVTFTSNKQVESWSISTTSTFTSLVQILSQGPYKCVVKANASGTNNDLSGTLSVTATRSNGDTDTINNINISYIPMTSITLSCSTLIVSENETATLVVTQNGTKSNLVTSSNINIQSIGYEANTTTEVPNFTPTTTVTDSDEGVIIRYSASVDIDVKFTVSVNSISSNSITVYYNAIVADKVEIAGSESQLHWMYDIITSGGADTSWLDAHDVSKKNLAQIDLNMGRIQSTSTTYDYSNMKYFRYIGTDFTVPSVAPFTNLCVPEGVKYFNWILGSNDNTTYRLITLPSTLEKAYVNLYMVDAFATNLKFDLSATKISRIYCPGTTVNNASVVERVNDFTIKLTGASGHVSSGELFIYPTTLTEIGNFKGTISQEENAAKNVLGIFNKIDVTTQLPLGMDSSNSAPLYKLPSLSRFNNSDDYISVGNIAKYKMNDSVFDSSSFPYISQLSHTFWNNSGNLSGTNEFTKVEYIGDYTFKENPSILKLGNKLKTIGYSAFSNMSGSFSETDLSNVETIATYAFVNVSTTLSLTFNKLISVGSMAFGGDQGGQHIITYTGTGFAYAKNSFGESKKVTLRISNQDFYDTLISDSDLVNNVKEIIKI